MDDLKRRLEKYLSPDDQDKYKDLRSGGIVDEDNQPLDRLRRSLSRVFPGMPTDLLVLKHKEEKE